MSDPATISVKRDIDKYRANNATPSPGRNSKICGRRGGVKLAKDALGSRGPRRGLTGSGVGAMLIVNISGESDRIRDEGQGNYGLYISDIGVAPISAVY